MPENQTDTLPTLPFQKILITGASGALGFALAEHYCASYINPPELILFDLEPGKLEGKAKSLRKFTKVDCYACDLSDRRKTEAAITANNCRQEGKQD